ncbi:MAG: glycosyltransferase family 87 protein [Sedimenticola sp.]
MLSSQNICKDRTLTVATFTLAGYILLSLGYHNYWNRPDPYLLLCTSLAILAYLRLTPIRSALVIGALTGIAAGFKVHALLYIIPIALSLVLLSSNESKRGMILLFGIGSAILLFLAPFLDPNVSLTAYFDYLLNASKHGLVYPLFLSNMKLAVIIASPALILLVVRQISLSNPIEVIILPFIISVFVAAVVAAKAGSGPHHLIPFIPVSIILGLYLVSRFKNHALIGPAMFAAVAVAMISYGMKEANAVVKRAKYAYSINSTITKKVNELGEIYAEYPDAEMGIGGIKENEDTFLRVELILQGGNATVEFGPWMDLHFSGISKKRLDPLTVECKVPQWIIPKESEPFSLPNVFLKAGSKEKLVTEEFLTSFQNNYQQVYKGSFYDVWSCDINE